jgi:hypothetical protein
MALTPPPPMQNNPLKATTPGRCRYCRCTDERACDDGCSWADFQHTVCDSPWCLQRWAAALIKELRLRVAA